MFSGTSEALATLLIASDLPVGNGLALLKTLDVTGFRFAALSPAEMADDGRRDFYIYIDEVQTFATLSLADILQEARRYRLNLIRVNLIVR